VLQMPVSLATFYGAARLLPPVLERVGERWGLRLDEGAADVAALPLLTLMGGAVSLGLMPAVNAVIRRGIEHRADEYALRLTGKREAFIGAMQKLGRMNLGDPDPPAIVKFLLHSHPTLKERIEHGKSFR
jgi:STE24 endopeptidase